MGHLSQENKDIYVLAKALADEKQIYSKIDKGAKRFEIQLVDDKFEPNDVYKKICNFEIHSIHTPLIYGTEKSWEEICISDLDFLDKNRVVQKTCVLAQNVADIQKHNVSVVLHCDLSLYEIKKYRMIYIYRIIDSLLTHCPNIDICLENISSIRLKPFRLDNGALFGAAEIAEHLNQVLDTKRVGAVLDICHMQMMQYMLACFSNSEIYTSIPQHDMKSFFKVYAPTLRLVHLNEAEKDGYGKRHGQVASVETVKEVLQGCLDNGCMPHFCLEVKEKNYFK